jgi:uncharacterized protein
VILPDVNVLLPAFRKDTPDHNQYRSWLDDIVNGTAAYGISPQVLASVIRLATNPRIYRIPSPIDAVSRFASALMSQPHCQIIQPGPDHWNIFVQLCETANATGNLVPDAWFAALAIESGCEWITIDRDFSRFEGLRWRPPF